MSQPKPHLITIAFLVATAAGCGASPAARFYTLSSTAKTEGATAAYAVGVGPVTVPSEVDRPQIVVQVAPNRVEIDEFSRWAAPLEEGIARAVAGNLAVILGTPDVAAAPLASLTPEFRVTIDVQRFDSVRGQSVVVDAVWAVRRTAGEQTRSGRTIARETMDGVSVDGLAAAHSRALARLSADIAVAIREMAARKG
jgi:uncharacterized lipoprotein YmbA